MDGLEADIPQLNLYAFGSFAASSSVAYVVGYLIPLALRAPPVKNWWTMLRMKVELAATMTRLRDGERERNKLDWLLESCSWRVCTHPYWSGSSRMRGMMSVRLAALLCKSCGKFQL
jgi:hypothetical protein